MTARRRHLPHSRKLLLAATMPLLLALAWVAGFAWFLYAVTRPMAPPPQADGIVALTGGAGRVEAALHLLAAGRARQLLVSGVGGAAEFAEMARRAHVDQSLKKLVRLGREAVTTRGNAIETAEWVHDHAIRSLIVVTAFYHMPRALVELSRTLPHVLLYPAPVWPPLLHNAPRMAALRLLAGEYSKFLAAKIGLSALVPRGENLTHTPDAEPHAA